MAKFQKARWQQGGLQQHVPPRREEQPLQEPRREVTGNREQVMHFRQAEAEVEAEVEAGGADGYDTDDQPPVRRFMGPSDVHFRKHQRLIPPGFSTFDPVQQWHKFRITRAG